MNSSIAQAHPLLARVFELSLQSPQRKALIEKDGRVFTYEQLESLVKGARAELIRRKVSKESRVLIAVPMSVELYACLLALFSLGGTAVFLDPWMKGKQMGKVIRQVRPEVMIISSRLRFLAYLLPSAWSIPSWWSIKSIEKGQGRMEFTPLEDKDRALITFTSGSSGSPKGADRSFGFLAAQMQALAPHLERETVQRDLTNFPIVGLANLALGNTVVIPPINLMKVHEASPTRLAEVISSREVSRCILSPSLMDRLIQGIQPSSSLLLGEIFVGGAPIAYSLIIDCLHKLPEVKFEAIFGSTEAEPVATASFAKMKEYMDNPSKGVFIGKPAPITRYKLVKACRGPMTTKHFEEELCQAGEIGELLVSGYHVNESYFENPRAFAENKVRDKAGRIWHRMGDMAYKKEEGLYLVGRLHRIIRLGKEEFHPFPLEFYLERELGIKDAAYVQQTDGSPVLYLGKGFHLPADLLREKVQELSYPLSSIFYAWKALPRDPRHQSKLNLKALKNVKGRMHHLVA